MQQIEADWGNVPDDKVAEIVAKIMQAQESGNMVDIIILLGRKDQQGATLPIRIQYRDFGH